MEIHTRQPMAFQVGPSTSQAQQKREMLSSVQLRQQQQQQHLLAVAVISRLHRWCVQLFWMTVLCVIGVVGDDKSTFSFEFLPHRYIQNGSSTGSGNGAVKLRKRHTLADIENKLLRHLTSPMLATFRPVFRHSQKRRQASRPPSPQLFDILEEDAC